MITLVCEIIARARPGTCLYLNKQCRLKRNKTIVVGQRLTENDWQTRIEILPHAVNHPVFTHWLISVMGMQS